MPFSLFKSRYLKDAALLAQNARKILHRRKDLLSEAVVADASSDIDKLEAAIKEENEIAVKEKSEHLDALFAKIAPHRTDHSWRENCEVMLVAFVIAIGIRAYFLQPFKIPTGSMQPTLNGNTGHVVSSEQPLPNFLMRSLEFLFMGRSYVNVVASEDDKVVDIKTVTHLFVFELTQIECLSGRRYVVPILRDTLMNPVGRDGFGVWVGNSYRKGQVIARGYMDKGDHVFVDKFTYHFRHPRRGDVFVFNTRGIPGIPIHDPEVKSQFYIKRLAAISGDVVRIASPRLFLNGELAKGTGFERVMSARDGYRGYANIAAGSFRLLQDPEDAFTVPPKSYFALGDNSYNSLDSRAWGRVPAENVVGRGMFVYYPFTRRWGGVR
jgi:signal peptidase I